jgi:hypothetical protein
MLYYIGVHQGIEWVGYIFWTLFYSVYIIAPLLVLALTLATYSRKTLQKLGDRNNTLWLNLEGSFFSDLISKPFNYLVLYILYTDGHTTELIFLMVSVVILNSLDRLFKRNMAKRYKLEEHIVARVNS